MLEITFFLKKLTQTVQAIVNIYIWHPHFQDLWGKKPHCFTDETIPLNIALPSSSTKYESYVADQVFAEPLSNYEQYLSHTSI